MDYVIRILDNNGKLKKERIMFHAVRILDNNGKLKKVVKSKLLSQMHWKEFPNYLKLRCKGKKNFNTYGEVKNRSTSIGAESYLASPNIKA